MVHVAMIGVGEISAVYLKNLTETFSEVELVGVFDLSAERAETAADFCRAQNAKGINCRVPQVYASMEAAFADPEVEVILNLTPPTAHYAITKAALQAGKHVYSEKPLAIDMAEADELVALAEEKGLRLGGAPDTFMGAGIQTCRKLIDDGVIGEVIGASCSMICHGHEAWHPNPGFFYRRGGGPMMDMGPYYVTALLQLMGEVQGVTGVTRRSFDRRVIGSQPHRGAYMDVEVDTYVTGTLHFTSGALATIFTTFDVHYGPQNQSRFEIYGSKGTLAVPDPNTFWGPVRLYRPEDQTPVEGDPALLGAVGEYQGFKEIPLLFDYRDNSRALGLADMCKAIETGRDHRANSQQQHHVLEILTAFSESSAKGGYLPLKTRYFRTAAMQNNPVHGILD